MEQDSTVGIILLVTGGATLLIALSEWLLFERLVEMTKSADDGASSTSIRKKS